MIKWFNGAGFITVTAFITEVIAFLKDCLPSWIEDGTIHM